MIIIDEERLRVRAEKLRDHDATLNGIDFVRMKLLGDEAHLTVFFFNHLKVNEMGREQQNLYSCLRITGGNRIPAPDQLEITFAYRPVTEYFPIHRCIIIVNKR